MNPHLEHHDDPAIANIGMQIQDTVGAPIPITYPHVLGSDAAGTVVKVGSGVTRFKEGDRVIG